MSYQYGASFLEMLITLFLLGFILSGLVREELYRQALLYQCFITFTYIQNLEQDHEKKTVRYELA